MTHAGITLRSAEAGEARKLFAIIQANLEEGHLLPRTLTELRTHAARFVVATRGRRIVGCAELASLSPMVAEVRSLAVDASARGFDRLCAFTHAPGYFTNMGFSIVPHTWLLEKIFTDCMRCPQFRVCGQYALVVPLDSSFDADLTIDAPSAGVMSPA
jgi:amino-acid N-acetyltransferase